MVGCLLCLDVTASVTRLTSLLNTLSARADWDGLLVY